MEENSLAGGSKVVYERWSSEWGEEDGQVKDARIGTRTVARDSSGYQQVILCSGMLLFPPLLVLHTAMQVYAYIRTLVEPL